MKLREGLLARARARLAAAREPIVAAWLGARRRPESVLAAALVVGVLVMILHWR
jgi:hypothetical protein